MSSITPVYGGRATITFEEGKHLYYVNVPDAGIKRLYQPSVTGILNMKNKSHVLIPWAIGCTERRALGMFDELGVSSVDRRIFEAILDASLDAHNSEKITSALIGSIVHRTIEQLLLHVSGKAKAPELPLRINPALDPRVTPAMIDDANKCVSAAKKFIGMHNIELVQVEAPRWSPTYGYIGTGDLIAKLNGVLSVLDFKTGKRPYAEYFLQTAAYQHAYQEEFPDQQISARWIVNVGRDGELQTESRTNETYDSDFKCFLSLLRVYRWDQENRGVYSKTPPRILGSLDKLLGAANAH